LTAAAINPGNCRHGDSGCCRNIGNLADAGDRRPAVIGFSAVVSVPVPAGHCAGQSAEVRLLPLCVSQIRVPHVPA
jgi:hypothetical protein